jgi:uncharacterized protein DUF11
MPWHPEEVTMRASQLRRLAAGFGTIAAVLAGAAWALPTSASAEEPADLWVSTSPGEVEAVPGDVVTISITIGNDGPEDAVTPRYTIFVSARLRGLSVPAGCRPVGTRDDFFDCPIDGLAAGAEIQREVTIEVVGYNTDGVSVSVWDGPPGMPVPSGNTASTLIRTATADLWSIISPEYALVGVGETVEVTLTIGNRGPRDAIEPRYELGAGGELELVTPPDGCVEQPGGRGLFHCPIESLPAGTQINETITVRMHQTRTPQSVMLVARDEATDEESNFSFATLELPTTSDISVEVPPVPGVVDVGEAFDVTITVRNAGPRVAQRVQVLLGLSSDDTPEDQSLFPATGGSPPSNCVTEGEVQPTTVLCTLESVPVNGSAELVYPLEARRPGEHHAQVIATVVGDGEYETGDDIRKDNHGSVSVTAATPGSPQPPGPGLPTTGIRLQVVVVAGLALLGGGAVLVLLASRRRRPPTVS